MSTPTPEHSSRPTPQAISSGIRDALSRIQVVDRDTNGYLKALAFILHRVADADENVSNEEVVRMESILIEHAGLTQPEAVLTVEIARHCRENSDCARAYAASRQLRHNLDESERLQLHRFLSSVAEADGTVRAEEKAIVRQIAAELGIRSR